VDDDWFETDLPDGMGIKKREETFSWIKASISDCIKKWL
jgi:hypothetical protein